MYAIRSYYAVIERNVKHLSGQRINIQPFPLVTQQSMHKDRLKIDDLKINPADSTVGFQVGALMKMSLRVTTRNNFV